LIRRQALKLYEAMFLMDPQTCSDASAMEAEIRRILERAEAEVIICRKWDDRRLAYEIKGRKRGSYWLTYFKAPPDKIAGIERDSQLSEKVLRVLVLRREEIPKSELARLKAAEAEAAAPQAAESAPAGSEQAEPAAEPQEAAAATAVAEQPQPAGPEPNSTQDEPKVQEQTEQTEGPERTGEQQGEGG